MAANFEIVEPAASALVESLRSFGYSPETALADLVDNSISAGAQNVWITFYWNGHNSFISLRDDGCGMTENELKEAMRPGSRSPLETRTPTDLGRFGLGLKTASFSQCRRLTVATKPEGGTIAIRRWDLDYLNVSHPNEGSGWRLLKVPAEGSHVRLVGLNSQRSGTIVLWEEMDRLTGTSSPDDQKAQDDFYCAVSVVEKHLGMVFHRFLSRSTPFCIYINGEDEDHRVRPWDPFLQEHKSTWRTPPEPIPLSKSSVIVRGFVLPHKDRLATADYDRSAGPRGWTAQQGFYVYRNDRLLVPGSWLGLGRGSQRWNKDEHFKLARISIDIPNQTDDLWQIDVKKSTARPPLLIKKRLRELAERVRQTAREVFAHRGTYSPRAPQEGREHIWRPIKKDNRVLYRIDRAHALVKSLAYPSGYLPTGTEALLRWLEETVPVHQIWLDIAEDAEQHGRPFETVDSSEVAETMQQFFDALLIAEKIEPEAARDRIRRIEPFRDHPDLINALEPSRTTQ